MDLLKTDVGNTLEQINSILKHLTDRGSDNDLLTMEMINRYYPFTE